MPHIHTNPGERDMTVSAYIVRLEAGAEPRCLVHMHRKIGKLLQVGGHIDLDQTPWQAVAAELGEEAGYELSQVDVLQPTAERIADDMGHVVHPVPFTLNTHNVGNDHHHSDICYGFVTTEEPARSVADGESDDLRWHTLAELKEGAVRDEVLPDIVGSYAYLIALLDTYVRVPAVAYSLEKPAEPAMTYTWGKPGQ